MHLVLSRLHPPHHTSYLPRYGLSGGGAERGSGRWEELRKTPPRLVSLSSLPQARFCFCITSLFTSPEYLCIFSSRKKDGATKTEKSQGPRQRQPCWPKILYTRVGTAHDNVILAENIKGVPIQCQRWRQFFEKLGKACSSLP